MTDGTAQSERFPRALEPGYFRPDELDFAQRVELTARLARQLRFHDMNHQEVGDWSALFTNDPTLMMARIAAADLWPRQQRFSAEADTATPAQLAAQALSLAGELDGWWRALAGAEDEATRQLCDRLELLITQQLAPDLRWIDRSFLQPQDTAGTPPAPGAVARELSALWQAPADEASAALPAAAVDDRERLRACFFTLLSAAEDVQHLAEALLPASLPTRRHEPAAALLIAFLQLCEVAQQQVNRLPARHVAFYLRDCLGFQPLPPRADRALLACERDLRTAGDVELPAGTAFDAGKDAAGRPVRFVTDAPLALTDLRVAALYTLHQERDSLIAPECHVAYVTRCKLAQPVPDGRRPWPLFGGGSIQTQDARIGLAVASPLLWLAEGEREIRLLLRQSEAGPGPRLLALRDAVLQARTPEALRAAFGVLLPHWLMAVSDAQEARALASGNPIPGDLDTRDWLELRAAFERVPRLAMPLMLKERLPPRRSQLFTRLLQGALRVSLSGATGWLVVDCRLERAERRATGSQPATAGCDLALRIRLKPDAPAIVGCEPPLHGADWTTRLPVLRLELTTQGRLYPYSLLSQLSLAAAELSVTVRGLRQLYVENHLGRLDASKAFMPFGPLPNLSSFVAIGAQEAARKNLDRLWLDLAWSELPADAGGFDAHYAGYTGPHAALLRQGDFTASAAWLRDGRWHPSRTLPGDERLFVQDAHSRELQSNRHIEIDPGSLRQLGRASSDDWGRMPRPRHGLLRLQLDGPRPAFGHAAYPAELAAAVSANARRRHPRPLPNPPYTPVIERLSLGYEASSVIALDRDDEPAGGPDCPLGERVFHLHPLGLQPLISAATGSTHRLLPDLGDNGNLYIGLQGCDAGGLLTLLFQLHDPLAASAAGDTARPALHWATLTGDDWRPLPPHRVLGDTTHGGITSGIVTLDLPYDMDTQHRIMPTGLYWLRLSASSDFEHFAGLLSVRTQGVELQRELAAAATATASGRAPAPPATLSDGAIGRPASGLRGLAAVTQVGRSFGLRREEDERALITRAGERLQHKNRASLGWDIERLLLERFPDICKVRCIPASDGSGRITVVVVPALPRNDPALACEMPRFNALDLARMADALRAAASPFADFNVRNPSYDQLQLRATISLRRGAHEGATLRRVNDAVLRALSPWFDDGYGPRFDWLVRAEELEARIRTIDGVQGVSRLSLLTLTCDDRLHYGLDDTAISDSPGAAHAQARVPWSLAVPLSYHLLTATDAPALPDPQPTGVSQLTVGSTFVIGRASP
ncbi:hypothetical protein [Pelomonas cellulosilytica]|uniref:Baseplate protein J-like domain-containing protein n=1 Tax=Pelomonas cellulosilytica TaxID=2906762 RepID=A0ABS8XT11_9BURK|nr:hypothetical protein [Pelomonas sp. P8]MCE4554328.1 hypothetical protein [Pelomonas sp. P8]